MEKIIYALWRDPAQARKDFNDYLLNRLALELAPLTLGLRINIQDEAVADIATPRFTLQDPPMEAFVQLWVNTAFPPFRAEIDAAIAKACARYAAWLVAESVPLPNDRFPVRKGERTEGFSQMALIPRPTYLDQESWRSNWQDGHTQIAIDTQDTFEYVQNLVVRPLTADAPVFAAVVEECFPPAAMTDSTAYFDQPGDPEGASRNEAILMESCGRFMGSDGCDCIPTSQYNFKWLKGVDG